MYTTKPPALTPPVLPSALCIRCDGTQYVSRPKGQGLEQCPTCVGWGFVAFIDQPYKREIGANTK